MSKIIKLFLYLLIPLCLIIGLYFYYSYFRFKSPIKLISQITKSDPVLSWQFTEQKILSDCQRVSLENNTYQGDILKVRLAKAVYPNAVFSPDGKSILTPANLTFKLLALVDDTTVLKTADQSKVCYALTITDSNTNKSKIVYADSKNRIVIKETDYPR